MEGLLLLSDLHCHLNGSFSLQYLEQTANRNGKEKDYERLVEIKEEYRKLTEIQTEEGYSQEHIRLIWQQFGQIHRIIQTLEDIKMGNVDVVRSSQANYLEIRTTPKSLINGK